MQIDDAGKPINPFIMSNDDRGFSIKIFTLSKLTKSNFSGYCRSIINNNHAANTIAANPVEFKDSLDTCQTINSKKLHHESITSHAIIDRNISDNLSV
jgi:hypothetical protein